MNYVPLASIKRLYSVPRCCVLPEYMVSGLAMQGKPVALSRGATQIRLKNGPGMGQQADESGRASVWVGALGRLFSPRRPKRTVADEMDRSIEVALSNFQATQDATLTRRAAPVRRTLHNAVWCLVVGRCTKRSAE